MTEPTEIKKGLAGSSSTTPPSRKVNPETNSLLYRGYPVQELAATQPFEEVAYLLWHGELPTDEQLAAVRGRRSARTARSTTTSSTAIDLLPLDAHPMDVVRTAVSRDRGARSRRRTTRSREADLAQGACACSRSCRRSSPTTSAAAAARSSSSRATTSTTRRTSSG